MIAWHRRKRACQDNCKSVSAPGLSGIGADMAPDRSSTDPVSIQYRSAVATPVLPSEHAQHFLAWLQAPGGRVGWIPATELAQSYSEFAVSKGLEPIGWSAVGRELRCLLQAQKSYIWLNGRKRRAYRIPAVGSQSLTVLRQDREQTGT